MSFISRFFGQKSDKPSFLTKKVKHVSASDIAAMPELKLIAFVQDGAHDIALRTQAVELMSFDACVSSGLLNNTVPDLQLVAVKHVAALLDAKKIAIDGLLLKVKDESVCLNITSYCEDRALLERVIGKVISLEQLTNIALQANASKVRQAAVQRIDDESALRSIQKSLKNKDKTAYKLIKEKLAVIRAVQRDEAALIEKLAGICENLERLVSTIDDHTFDARLEQYQAQWQQSREKTGNATLDERFNAAYIGCKLRSDAVLAEQAQQVETEQAKVDAEKMLLSVVNELQQFLASLFTIPNLDAHTPQSVLKTLTDSWERAENIAAAKPLLKRNYQHSVSDIQGLLLQLQGHGSLAEQLANFTAEETNTDETSNDDLQKILLKTLSFAKHLSQDSLPESVKVGQQAVANLVAEQQAAQQSIKDAHGQITGLIRKGNDAVNRGNLRQLMGIRESITRKCDDVTTLPESMQEKITTLDAGIEKLQDYRNFATEPKKLALIDLMKVLANAAEQQTIVDIEDHADQLKKLQQDWKVLVVGGKDTQPELWEQFHALSQTAYEPVNAFFDERSNERTQNVALRKALVVELEAYAQTIDWNEANFKTIEEIIRTAKKQWTGYFPVERKSNTVVEKQFTQVLQGLQLAIDSRYETAKVLKQAVVNQAKGLVELDSQAAIETVKNLQAQWKLAGRTWSKVDRPLWNEFKCLCDAVFEKKQQEKTEFIDQLNTHLVEAEKLCTTLEDFVAQGGKILVEKRLEIQTTVEQFNALGELPKAKKDSVHQRFIQARDAIDTMLEQYRVSEIQNIWQAVFSLKENLNTCLASQDSDELGESLEGLKVKQEAIKKWPASSQNVLNGAIDLAQSLDVLSAEQLIDNAAAMRLLCIHLEVSLDIASPDEDKEQRMAYQMQRLQDGMANSAGTASKDDVVLQANLNWLALPAVEASVYKTLFERFTAAKMN